jgi:type II secretory ATPase GspE/PulE/Tfp pilus assembly ATPase PilB-like protein
MSNSATNSPDDLNLAQGNGPIPQGHVDGKGAGEHALRGLAKLNVSSEAVRALPSEFVKQYRVLPVAVRNGTIRIATSDPGNQRVIDDIRLLSGLEVEEFVAPSAEILEKIAECYQVTVEQMIENLDPEQSSTAESRNLHDIEVMANEPTVINLVNLIISEALQERAIDIHCPLRAEASTAILIDGCCRKKQPPPNNFMPP